MTVKVKLPRKLFGDVMNTQEILMGVARQMYSHQPSLVLSVFGNSLCCSRTVTGKVVLCSLVYHISRLASIVQHVHTACTYSMPNSPGVLAALYIKKYEFDLISDMESPGFWLASTLVPVVTVFSGVCACSPHIPFPCFPLHPPV